MQAKVSIVIACYNKEKYIGELLDSILAQTWDSIEVVIVNDGSSDRSLEAILGYLPRLRQRGFETIIINQENTNVNGAVKHGLSRIHGTYVCVPDADDVLAPAYVSTMAGWLEEHPEYEWAACNFDTLQNIDSRHNLPSFSLQYDPVEMESMGFARVVNYFLARCDHGIQRLCVRTSYLKQCRVIENYYEGRYANQEGSYQIPLAAYGGKIKYFPKILYFYRMSRNSRSDRSFDASMTHVEDQAEAARHSINRLTLPDKEKTNLLSIVPLYVSSYHWTFYRFTQSRAWQIKCAEELCEIVNTIFSPSPEMQYPSVLQYCWPKPELLFQAIGNNLIGRSPTTLNRKFSRVIGFGALGTVASRFLPLLPMLHGQHRQHMANLSPTHLWDANAFNKPNIGSLLVQKPDLSSLTPNDLVLVFPRKVSFYQEILSELSMRGIPYLDYFDLMDILTSEIYPAFYDKYIYNSGGGGGD